jgi:hypothetical protein
MMAEQSALAVVEQSLPDSIFVPAGGMMGERDNARHMSKGSEGAGTPACRNAVLFLIFNRPDTTMEVLRAIGQARPPRLYIACDGPRASRAGEAAAVQTLRKHVLGSVDWPCEVHTLFRDQNLGCRNAVSGAISWFFEKEEQGIILEDDCLPSATFFRFCDDLLEKHANDATVGGITGDFRIRRSARENCEYGRVGYPLIWGWASWRRVWRSYDPSISAWKGDPMQVPRMASKGPRTRTYLTDVFNAVHSGSMDTWDFQFNFMCLHQEMDFLHPYVNMISNIGFASGATHTSDPADPNAALPRADVSFPLKGPVDDRTYEQWLDRNIFANAGLPSRALKRFRRWTRTIIPRI